MTLKKDPKLGQPNYDLLARVTDLESFTGGKTTARLDLYVSEPNGDDTNEGTKEAPLKTLTEAYRRIPDIVEHPVVIHVGPHSGTGYDLPALTPRMLRETVYLIGDGAGQGTDGFKVLASGTVQAGSGNSVVVTSGGLGTDTYQGKTIEFTSGDAKGVRRTIQQHTDTNITPCIAFPSGTVSTGDSWRIVEPEVYLHQHVEEFMMYGMHSDSRRASSDRRRNPCRMCFINFRLLDNYFSGDGNITLFGCESVGAGFFVPSSIVWTIGTDAHRAAEDGVFFGASSNEDWLGWGLFSDTTLFPGQISTWVSYGVVIQSGMTTFGGVYEMYGGLIDGNVTVNGGSHVPSSVEVRGKTHLSDIDFQINGKVIGNEQTNIKVRTATVTNSGDTCVEASNVGSFIEVFGDCTLSGADCLVAKRGGQIRFQNSVSLTATGDETKVINGNGADITQAKASYSADGNFISADDGTVIRRDDEA